MHSSVYFPDIYRHHNADYNFDYNHTNNNSDNIANHFYNPDNHTDNYASMQSGRILGQRLKVRTVSIRTMARSDLATKMQTVHTFTFFDNV